MLSVITPTVGSYFKGAKRSDCAGATCTYAEEMTNYANWYAYYHTRMQMMKTAASIAFSAVDDKFRVGFYSINDGAGNQFLNPDAFDGAQKNLWYSKFFSATPLWHHAAAHRPGDDRPHLRRPAQCIDLE